MAGAARLDQVRRRATRAKASRRERLLDEAARQLNAKGVSLTSLTEIADTLGVSRAALYYYVDDREDLVFQVYRRSCEIMARRLGEAARSGRAALEVIRSFIGAVLDPNEPEVAALSEIGLLREAERETVLGMYEGLVARLAGVVEAGQRSGELRTCDPEIASRTVISMIYWIPLSGRWTMAIDHVDRSDLTHALSDVIAVGVSLDRSGRADLEPIDFSPLAAKSVAPFDREGLAQARRETILVTASRLFNRKGVDTTSLDEIAAELGATKRALYHYVGDKQALLAACYARAYRIYRFIGEKAEEGGRSSIEALTRGARATAIAEQREDLSPLRPLVGFEGLGAAAQDEITAQSRAMTQHGREAFSEAQRQGVMRPIAPDLFNLILPGATSWLAKGLTVIGPERQVAVSEEIAELLRVGLKAV